MIGNFIVQLLLHIFFHFHALHCLLSPPRNKMDDGKHVADLFFKGVVYGFNTLDLLPISSSIFVSEAGNIVVSEASNIVVSEGGNIVVSEAGRFD